MSVARRTWDLLRTAARRFLADDALDHAAAIAFYTLISLGPLGYLLLWASSAWLRDAAAVRTGLDLVAEMIPPEAAEGLRAAFVADPDGPGLALLAVPVLLWVASTALVALEHGINVAFGLAGRRSRWRSRLKGLALVAIGCAVLATLHAVRQRVGAPDGAAGGHADLLATAATLLSELLLLVATFVVFVAFFTVLPRRRVALRSAVAGALAALVGWEIAREVFGTWLARSVAQGVRTGTFASLAALALWIYAAAVVVLAGAEVAAAHAGVRRTGRAARRLDPRGDGDYVPPPDR